MGCKSRDLPEGIFVSLKGNFHNCGVNIIVCAVIRRARDFDLDPDSVTADPGD